MELFDFEAYGVVLLQNSWCWVELYGNYYGSINARNAFDWSVVVESGSHFFTFYLNKDWGCVILREIDFLLKICWSIPCLHPSWKVHTWIEICASLNHRKKTKADGSRLIPRKHTETLVLLSVLYVSFFPELWSANVSAVPVLSWHDFANPQ